MRRYLAAVLGALASAGYWWLAVTLAYGLTAGDVSPAAAAPPEGGGSAILVALGIVAVLLYAALALAWGRIVDRLLPR